MMSADEARAACAAEVAAMWATRRQEAEAAKQAALALPPDADMDALAENWVVTAMRLEFAAFEAENIIETYRILYGTNVFPRLP